MRIEADQHTGPVSDDPLNDRSFTVAYSTMIWPRICDRAREKGREENLTLWTERVSLNTVLNELRMFDLQAFCIKSVWRSLDTLPSPGALDRVDDLRLFFQTPSPKWKGDLGSSRKI